MAKKSKPKLRHEEPITDKDHLLEKVAAIGRRMDSMEEIVGSLADADDKAKAKMIAKFGASRRRVRVYLALDGIKDAPTVGRLLRIHRQNVNKEIRALRKSRLIDIAESNGRGDIFRKRSIDKFTGLSDDLMEKFNLDKDGRLLK
jgi:hypothetical protein